MRKMKISVAMAVYNGEKYVKEQLDSILCQLDGEDEVCISVDPSTDDSYRMLVKLSEQEPRIKVGMGLGQGVKKNFEQAIKMCTGDIIFLSDQDDVWKDDKVIRVLECFADEEAMLVLHDVTVMNENLTRTIMESFFAYRECKPGILNNVIKNSYMGCAMAFRKELVPYILPIPASVPMHDQWIGLVAEKKGKVIFLPKQLLKYRRHNDNATDLTHSDAGNMLKWRTQILAALMKVK